MFVENAGRAATVNNGMSIVFSLVRTSSWIGEQNNWLHSLLHPRIWLLSQLHPRTWLFYLLQQKSFNHWQTQFHYLRKRNDW